MTEKFPALLPGQVALSRADINTGIVLDEDGTYALDERQRVYTIYNDASNALEIAKTIIRERPDIECYIHSNESTLLYFVNHESIAGNN